MLERFRRRRRNRAVVDALWDQIVERARRPERFEAGGLPDTVLGRFESLGIEMFLLMRRAARSPELHDISQDLVDRFMTDLDHSMRELGIGYLAVPKRMRILAGRFYARVKAFEAPLAARDEDALAGEIVRLVHRDAPGGDSDLSRTLAGGMLRDADWYDRIEPQALLSGRLTQTENETTP